MYVGQYETLWSDREHRDELFADRNCSGLSEVLDEIESLIAVFRSEAKEVKRMIAADVEADIVEGENYLRLTTDDEKVAKKFGLEWEEDEEEEDDHEDNDDEEDETEEE